MSSYDLETLIPRNYNTRRSESPSRTVPFRAYGPTEGSQTVNLSAVCKDADPYYNQDSSVIFPWRQMSPDLSTYDFAWNGGHHYARQGSPISSAECALTEDGSNALSPHIAAAFEPIDYTNPNSFPGSPSEHWANVDDIYIPHDYSTIPFSNGGSAGLLHVQQYPKSQLSLHHLPPALPSQAVPMFQDDAQSFKRKASFMAPEEDYHQSEEEFSDYTPQARKKSKPSRSTKVMKAPKVPYSRPSLPCPHNPYNSSAYCHECSKPPQKKHNLAKHLTPTHNRLFACTFRIYGCTSTFGSKNEWKRHVATKHLKTAYWRCDRGRCIPSKKDDQPKDFNRKDLFMQHIRRMHMPSHARDKEELNSSIDTIARDCYHHVRDPPPQSICGFCYAEGKKEDFVGPNSWEHRMEHVGKHLESPGSERRACDIDGALEDWLIKEELIVGNGRDGYVLASLMGDGKGKN